MEMTFFQNTLKKHILSCGISFWMNQSTVNLQISTELHTTLVSKQEKENDFQPA